MEYVSFIPSDGFSVLNTNVDDGQGKLMFKLVNLAMGKSGAVNIGKLSFRVLDSSDKSKLLNVDFDKLTVIMVSGQQNLWNPAKMTGSDITVLGGNVGGIECGWCGSTCIKTSLCTNNSVARPIPNRECVKFNDRCVIRLVVKNSPTPTTTVVQIAKEGEPCGFQNIVCASGLFCDKSGGDDILVSIPEEGGICMVNTQDQ
jgi:hypothetical protein